MDPSGGHIPLDGCPCMQKEPVSLKKSCGQVQAISLKSHMLTGKKLKGCLSRLPKGYVNLKHHDK